jgi:hypothetical protein
VLRYQARLAQAEADQVYKVVRRDDYGVLHSPYHDHFIWNIGKRYTIRSKVTKTKSGHSSKTDIAQAGFYVYLTKRGAASCSALCWGDGRVIELEVNPKDFLFQGFDRGKVATYRKVKFIGELA